MQPGAENFELAAALFGELLDTLKGTHQHKCLCGHKWQHANSCAGDAQAHTCSKCGAEVWFRHYGG